MPVVKKKSATTFQVREGLTRRIIHTEGLMMAVIEFTDGPWPESEPLSNHVHEQATFVAEGEIIFFCEGEDPETLGAGDMFCVPSKAKHGIRLLTPRAVLVDTFNPVRQDFINKK